MRSISANLSFHSRSRVRATSRFSGSTATNRRRANSASYRAPFQGQLPLAIELTGLGCDLIEGGHRDLELGRPHGFQEGPRDRRVDLITTHRLAGLARVMSMDELHSYDGIEPFLR